MSCVDVVKEASRCSTPNPPNIQCVTALSNKCQRPLVVSATPGSVVAPSDPGVQRVCVQSSECVHLAPGETKTMSFMTQCIDPRKAYPQQSAVHVSAKTLTVAEAGGHTERSLTQSDMWSKSHAVSVPLLGAMAIAGEVVSCGWILGAPSSWSPYQTRRLIRWSMPMVLSSLVGVTQMIYGGLASKFTGLLLASLPVLLKTKIAEQPLFTDRKWNRLSSGEDSGWTLECKAFGANRSVAIRIRVAVEGVVANFSSRRGRGFSETVPYPEKEFLSMFSLVPQSVMYIPRNHLLRMTFTEVRLPEVTLMARASERSATCSETSVESDMSWINLSDALQPSSGTNDQD
uniref:Uncharacterized protein n=1 Tax=Noctiluca scintillans TaxID=2966 RepID=A0A7S1FE55_NOCSC|mmetsp:Transcript_53434/g.142971  ORF Transcript_53434/g.142971 Transcript_53434/m.142971 type:complete len:345 (+) Transcript_53434:54-1088(+)